MVLLVAKFNKLCSKMEDHVFHHHHDHHNHSQSQELESLKPYLQAFKLGVSTSFKNLFSNSKPDSQTMSLPWILQCFEILPNMHKAFTKLVVEIDYPMSRWEEAGLMDEYLNYTMSLLDHLNAISSSISHLGQARLSLSHAISLVEGSKDSSPKALERLKGIHFHPESSSKERKLVEKHQDGEEEKEEVKDFSGKELLIHEALMFMKGFGLRVCGTVLFALSGDASWYLKSRELVKASVEGIDSELYEMIVEKRSVLIEVKEINDSVSSMVDAIEEEKETVEVEELRERLEGFEKQMEGLNKEVDRFFFEIMASRSKLIDCLRQGKE